MYDNARVITLLVAKPLPHSGGDSGLVPRDMRRPERLQIALTRGLPNKFFAFDLEISPRTFELHRANLMSKLQVRTLSAALQIALAAGLDGEPPYA